MQCQVASFDLPTATWQPATLPALDSARTLVLGFGAPELADDPRVFDELAKAYPRSLVIGCSSAGEIHGTTLRDHSLALTVTRFDKTDLQLASLDIASAADSHKAGIHLAKKLSAKPGLRAVLVLSEGLHVNGSELVRGLSSSLPPTVVVTGGLSADGPRFHRTWVAIGPRVASDVIAAVGFYGDHLVIGHGSKGGWDKFGPERLVTHSQGNVLFELDGRPALALYKEYLGDKAKDLPASGLLFPLSIRANASDDKPVVRTLLSVDHERQSLTFAGDIPKGHLAQLMKADFDRLIDGAGVAGSLTLDSAKPPKDADSLVIAISCVGRRLVLGARTEEEIEAVRDAVRSDRAHITGFYSYGEISPFASGSCDLHNQTMTLTLLSEAPAPLPRAHQAPGAPAPRALPSLEDTNTDIVAPPQPPAAAASQGARVASLSYDLPTRSWSEPLPALDSARTLVLGFGAPELADDPRVFDELAKAYPRSLVIGCSSAGEIHGTTLRDHSLALTVTRFDKTDLQLASLDIASAADSHKAGIHLAKKLSAKPGLRAVLVLSEGLHVNGSELVRGLSSSLPPTVVVTGGLSADGPRFHRTWVAIGPRVASDVIAAVGFYGDHLVIGHGSKGGWDKFGPERLVTHSQGNVLFELDGRPALALYKEYLGDKAKDLPSSGLLFPLSIRASASDDAPVVRTLLSVDHERQSLTFAGDIPKGHLAQLMKADFDRLIDGAGVAGSLTLDSAKPPKDADSLVIAISCVGRRLVLGARTEEEIEAVRDAVRSDRAHITGFYSYGEISPFASGACDLHNQTMTLTLLSEAQAPLPRALQAPAPRATETETSAIIAAVAAPRPPVAFPTVKTSIAAEPSQPLPIAGPPAAAGTIVRLPPAAGGDAAVETSQVGALQLVRMRGRITEAFKGEQLGRTLGPRVVFDLGDVDRVTSFGVREWLAMLAAATRVTELTFVRCSEAIVNQLTMIRKFDGGAKIASFFMPYLCDECGATLECLRDCEHDAAELASHAPAPVRCPRCDGEARFDDDVRSYFAFATPHFGVALPADVRALADSLARQTAAPPTEEIEKIIDQEGTRVRVLGRLTAQLRWRKIFDGIEGALTLDLATAPAYDTAGLAHLDQALRALPAEVAPICIEHAPPALVERLAQTPNERVRVVSAAAAGYCRSCAVNRPALVHLGRLAEDLAAGREHQVMCKRCNGPLALTLDGPLRTLLERGARPTPSAAPALVIPAPSAPAGKRGISPGVVALLVALAAAIGALAILLRSDRGADARPAPPAPLAAAVAPAPQPAAWSATADLPPEWTERELVLKGDDLFVVGRARVASERELGAGLEAARRAATTRLVRQLQTELEGSPVLAFVAARSRPDASANEETIAEAIATRFEAQHGKELALSRVETATRRLADGAELYARYRVPRAQYQAVLASYRATYSFRGLQAALFFPTLEGALHAGGQLIVIAVERRSLAASAGVREGDVILSVASTPVSTLDSLRATATAAWTALAPRGRLAIELESAGARKVMHLAKPSPIQPQ